MVKVFLQLFYIAFFLTLTSGCFSDGGNVEFTSGVDFANTEIVVLGDGIANGSSFLYIEVHVLNSDGSPVVNFLPELSVEDSSLRSCGRTNSQGIARCAITSSLAGTKNLTLTNLEFNVHAEAMFVAPVLSKSVISNVPGSAIVNTSGGHKISASLSNLSVPLKYEHPSGHKVYSTVQGIVLSEE